MSHAITRPAGSVRPLAERTMRESAYLVLDLVVGVAGFSIAVSALATGVSLAITLVGIPILAATLLLARYAAVAERARARALLGLSLAPPAPRPTAATLAGRVLSPLRDGAAWRATAYFLLMLPVGVATFCAAVVWWAATLFLVTLPAWAWALPHHGPRMLDGSWWSAPWQLALSFAIGLVLVAATPFVIHAITRAHRALLRLIGTR